MKKTHRTSASTSAFTLVELLTVIVIIGILAAIIIPVIGKVRESARRTQSLNNLRQIAVAMNLYAGENRGNYPLMGSAAGFDAPYWPARILSYLSPKVHVGEIFTTAGYNEQSPVLLDPLVANGKHHRISDYGNNARAIRPGNDGALNISGIITPSSLILVLPSEVKADATQAAWYLDKNYYSTPAATSVRPSDRGSPGRFMAGFADGHVSTLKYADLQDSETRKRLFCPDPSNP